MRVARILWLVFNGGLEHERCVKAEQRGHRKLLARIRTIPSFEERPSRLVHDMEGTTRLHYGMQDAKNSSSFAIESVSRSIISSGWPLHFRFGKQAILQLQVTSECAKTLYHYLLFAPIRRQHSL